MAAPLPSPSQPAEVIAPVKVPKRAAPRPRTPEPAPTTVRMTMYFSPEGILHHTRCQSRLHFRGVRAGLEADFFCASCHEHVSVPKYAVSQIPVESTPERKTVVLLSAVGGGGSD
jgi:hypothetical protein